MTRVGGSPSLSLLQICQMEPEFLRELGSSPTFALERAHVHVLLLVHRKRRRSLQLPCLAWSLDTLKGPPPSTVDSGQARKTLIAERDFR